MHRLNQPIAFLVFALASIASGCSHHQSRQTAQETPSPALALPVEGWDGVNNLFQEGDVYFGGQPDSASFVRFATEAGMATIVSLRSPEEHASLPFDEARLVSDLGMSFVQIPVDPATLSTDELARLRVALEESDGPLLIHCGSSNRVGGVWAAHLFHNEGLTLEDALERGSAAGLRRETMIQAVHRIAGEK